MLPAGSDHSFFAVVGIQGISWERCGPKAFIVRKGEVTEDEIMAFVAEHVAPYKRVRLVQFIDQVPKSPTGKILRRMLKGM